MNKSEIFKNAHSKARKSVKLIGNYSIAFKFALQYEYDKAEAKKNPSVESELKLLSNGDFKSSVSFDSVPNVLGVIKAAAGMQEVTCLPEADEVETAVSGTCLTPQADMILAIAGDGCWVHDKIKMLANVCKLDLDTIGDILSYANKSKLLNNYRLISMYIKEPNFICRKSLLKKTYGDEFLVKNVCHAAWAANTSNVIRGLIFELISIGRQWRNKRLNIRDRLESEIVESIIERARELKTVSIHGFRFD